MLYGSFFFSSQFSQIPDRYDEIYLRLSRQGARVLALGHRNLGILSNQQVSRRRRRRRISMRLCV